MIQSRSVEARVARSLSFLAALVVATSALSSPSLSARTFTVSRAGIGGDGGTDYLAADTATGRVYVSRGTHVMVVDGATAKVIADIGDTPRVHGIGFARKSGHGFTTNAGDSTSTMFGLRTMAVIRKVRAGKDGLDGIMYDDATHRILTIDHSKPMGTAVVIDPARGECDGPTGIAVDALGWDQGQKLMYIPAGRDGTVTVYHEDTPDEYSLVATVKTMPGVMTIAVDEKLHVAYGSTPEYGPPPALAAGESPPPGGRPRRGPVIGTAFFTITH